MEITPMLDANGVHRIDVIDYDGYRFSDLTPDKNPRQHIQNLKSLTFEGHEICIACYPKSGTHWLYELVNMLRNKKAEFHNDMLPNFDFVPIEYIKTTYTKGIYVTHLYPRHIPPNLMKNHCKIITIVRNPKAVAVSMFNFLKKTKTGHYMKDISFHNFLEMFLKGYVQCGSWLNWMTSWRDFQNENPNYPVLALNYEELKTDLERNVQKISDFLGTECSSTLIEEISSKCQFSTMSKHKHEHVPDRIVRITDIENQHIFYRRGESNDWKNFFTVSENEEFDLKMQKALAEHDLKVIY